MRHPKCAHSFEVRAELPDALAALVPLARNLYWSWHHGIRELFASLDPEAWEAVEHNPIELLNRLSPEQLQRLASHPELPELLHQAQQDLETYLQQPGAFPMPDEGKSNKVIAYFCAEFGISEALPIYSGGLGVLAGDHLKAASDLGLPIVGVGLLYSRGYFRQTINHDGWQQERYPAYDFYKMPLSLVRGEDRQPVRVEVELPDRTVTCQIWRAQVGKIDLLLLDSNVLENAPDDQGITDTLYGGDQEMRIRQELILGVGGMRALKALGYEAAVCHMNEGHAAFLTLERIRQFMEVHGCDFRVARKIVASSNVFTTHTPVPAGFDVFPADLVRPYVSRLLAAMQLSFDDFMRMGRIERDAEASSFNMAVFAMENANYINGVSKLHASVSREMFHGRWPEYPIDEAPIQSITNGIHTMTWVSRRMAELFDRSLGPRWRLRADEESSWAGVDEIDDTELWRARQENRRELIDFVRSRLTREYRRRGATQDEVAQVGELFDADALTIGFARRFATYKRASLMLADRERLRRILFAEDRPVQIIVAGKSHPRDDGGKGLIQEFFRFIHHEGGRARLIFLEDYDMDIARRLVQGVDVWLNNPLRPHEASGTSGMKVVPNGGLNCSVLDGWWDEGYDPEVGWAIGDREDGFDPGRRDWLDSQALYYILESEIVPKFYHRGADGVPNEWLRMMKASIRRLAPQFSTHRMVADYASTMYRPAWDAYGRLTADGLAPARSALDWRDRVRAEWPNVAIRRAWHNAESPSSLGQTVVIEADVELGAMHPGEIRVEALLGEAGPNRDLNDAVVLTLEPVEGSPGRYRTEFRLDRPGHRGFTLRVRPFHPDVAVPEELTLVRWE